MKEIIFWLFSNNLLTINNTFTTGTYKFSAKIPQYLKQHCQPIKMYLIQKVQPIKLDFTIQK